MFYRFMYKIFSKTKKEAVCNLAEFMWRKRHKNDPYSLFDSFLRAIIKIYPPIKNDRQRIENRDPGASGDSSNSDDDDEEEASQPGPSTKKQKAE